MKMSLLAAAAFSGVLLASAAQAQVVGDVGVSYQRSILKPSGPGDVQLNNWQAEGVARYDLGKAGVSLDGQITDVGGDVDDTVDYAFTGHLNTRLNGDTLVGGFAGVDAGRGFTFWGVGVEGQTKLTAKDSLYGQVGYGSSDDLGNPDVWAARLELRHFYTDHLKVQGAVGYLKVDTNLGDFDSWNLGLETEYQFAGTPWSVRAGYDFSRLDKLDTNGHAFRIGARYTFGAPSLKAREDAGADLGALRNLFGSALGL